MAVADHIHERPLFWGGEEASLMMVGRAFMQEAAAAQASSHPELGLELATMTTDALAAKAFGEAGGDTAAHARILTHRARERLLETGRRIIAAEFVEEV